MRNLSSNAIGLLLFITIVFISCKKTNNDFVSELNEKATITSQSFSKQVIYAETNLKKITTEIAKLTIDPLFVNFIHSEVSKKFDNEYEVLISDLKKSSTWGSKLNSTLLNEGLNAFQNIPGANGGSFNPQIYIPKFQYDEETNSNFSNTVNNATDTILFITYGGGTATDVDNFPAYYLDENNNLIYWGLVNETYANTHEVWVTSINDLIAGQNRLALPLEPCTNEYGEPAPCQGGSLGGSGGGGISTSSNIDPTEAFWDPHPDRDNHLPVNCKIQNMKVKVHNEYWVSGGSEIAIRSKLHCHNDRKYGNPAEDFKSYSSSQYSNLTGKYIRKFSRYQVNNQSLINVNYPLEEGWPTDNINTSPIFCDYVIFERDLFPASIQNRFRAHRNITNPNLGFEINNWAQHYRSADNAYITDQIANHLIVNGPSILPYYNNSITENSDIYLTTIGY